MKKKALAFVLSMAMCFGAAVPAFAATTPVELTQEEKDAIAAAHTYKAYQIFVGSSINAKGEIGNIAFGSDFEAVRADLAKALGIPATSEAKDFAEAIQNYSDAEALAAVIAKAVDKNSGYSVADDKKINGVASTYAIDSNVYTLGVGYYLVVDITELPEEMSVYINRSQLQVVKAGEAIAIQAKLNGITSFKEVKDTNDSYPELDAQDQWKDSADYDWGDDVPFKLTATLPGDYDYYTEYEYIFRDEQEKGLKFNNDIKVSVDGNQITEGFEVLTENIGTDTFQVKFANLKNIQAVTKDSVITVEYTSKLDPATAVIGAKGNKNKMTVEFRNDQGGHGRTPWDTVIVFTFRTDINKVTELNGNTVPLTGAEFKIEKLAATKVDGKFVVTKDQNDEEVVIKTLDVTVGGDGDKAGTVFSSEGLDDGVYKITETTTPAGYNSIDPIYFVIVAEHDKDAADPKLTALYVTNLDGKTISTSKSSLDLGEFTFTHDIEPGTVDTSVINTHGVVLPSTGGIGTTIFYIIGGVLVVGAVVLLVVRRKMRTEEE